ncbi:MAG: hypothetical protein JSR34_03990 [Proteobacteria bacterium]|nr:hypothetical protein [Pseudomonadota bacterium]
MEAFLQRLKERKLVQWALAYIAAAFALIQVLDVVAQRFGWPDALERVLILALALGFLVTLVVAWYHGEKGAQKVSGTELLILALLLGVGGGLLLRFARQDAATSPSAQTHADTATSASSTAAIPDKSIAVLPFENLSGDKDNAYFVAGMQDLILTKLADIGDLKVISRTSTAKYASHPGDLKTIGEQLRVATILEGSVQKQGNQVLINVQLIDAKTDVHLWAQAYPRTLDSIFGVEGEVAQAVADALKAKLTGAEQRAVASKGTDNPAALDAYLRGRALDNAGLSYLSVGRVVDFYQQAVREDPHYVQAWAALVIAMSGNYMNGYDAQRSTAQAIRDAADTALRLQPDAAESLQAQGAYFYRVQRDYAAARAFYLRALDKQPGNVDTLSELFFVERRMGLWNAAIAHFHAVLTLDPRNYGQIAQGAAEIFFYLHRYDEARGYLMQALKVAPDDSATNAILASLELSLGQLDAADAWLVKVPADSSDYYETLAVTQQLLYRRRYPDLAARAARILARDESNWNDGDFVALIAAAWAERWSGHSDRARQDFAKLRHAIDVRGGIGSAAQMNNFQWQAPLIYAGLGDWQQADAVASQAVGFAQGDTVETAFAMQAQAIVYAQQGERDKALALLTRLLAMPAGSTPPQLALDPFWDPLRSDPRFVALSKQPIVEYRIPPTDAR